MGCMTVYIGFYNRGAFVIEYLGEVCTDKEFRNRTKMYAKARLKHHYFMKLKGNEIIDATKKGNESRFINHSCDPSCETQKVRNHMQNC